MRGDSGSDRLARLLGFGQGKLEDQDAMAQALDLRNLIPAWPGPRRGVGDAWPVDEARSAAKLMLRELRGRKVIFLGRRVADAFGLQAAKPYAITLLPPTAGAMLIHHPAGSSRVWSTKGEEARAAQALRSFLLEVPQGPGAMPVEAIPALPPGRIPTTAPAVAMVLDDAQLLALKRSGASCEAIADKTGVSRQAVHQRLQRILRDYHAQNLADTQDLRALEAVRLEHLELKIADGLTGGDLKAVDRALRISERRSRLLGLDAPARHELSGPGGGPIPTAGPNLSKLSIEELEQLDGLLARADAADHSG